MYNQGFNNQGYNNPGSNPNFNNNYFNPQQQSQQLNPYQNHQPPPSSLFYPAKIEPYNNEQFLCKTFNFRVPYIDAFLSLTHEQKLKFFLLVEQRRLTGVISDEKGYKFLLNKIATIVNPQYVPRQQQQQNNQFTQGKIISDEEIKKKMLENQLDQICDFEIMKLGVRFGQGNGKQNQEIQWNGEEQFEEYQQAMVTCQQYNNQSLNGQTALKKYMSNSSNKNPLNYSQQKVQHPQQQDEWQQAQQTSYQTPQPSSNAQPQSIFDMIESSNPLSPQKPRDSSKKFGDSQLRIDGEKIDSIWDLEINQEEIKKSQMVIKEVFSKGEKRGQEEVGKGEINEFNSYVGKQNSNNSNNASQINQYLLFGAPSTSSQVIQQYQPTTYYQQPISKPNFPISQPLLSVDHQQYIFQSQNAPYTNNIHNSFILKNDINFIPTSTNVQPSLHQQQYLPSTYSLAQSNILNIDNTFTLNTNIQHQAVYDYENNFGIMQNLDNTNNSQQINDAKNIGSRQQYLQQQEKQKQEQQQDWQEAEQVPNQNQLNDVVDMNQSRNVGSNSISDLQIHQQQQPHHRTETESTNHNNFPATFDGLNMNNAHNIDNQNIYQDGANIINNSINVNSLVNFTYYQLNDNNPTNTDSNGIIDPFSQLSIQQSSNQSPQQNFIVQPNNQIPVNGLKEEISPIINLPPHDYQNTQNNLKTLDYQPDNYPLNHIKTPYHQPDDYYFNDIKTIDNYSLQQNSNLSQIQKQSQSSNNVKQISTPSIAINSDRNASGSDFNGNNINTTTDIDNFRRVSMNQSGIISGGDNNNNAAVDNTKSIKKLRKPPASKFVPGYAAKKDQQENEVRLNHATQKQTPPLYQQHVAQPSSKMIKQQTLSSNIVKTQQTPNMHSQQQQNSTNPSIINTNNKILKNTFSTQQIGLKQNYQQNYNNTNANGNQNMKSDNNINKNTVSFSSLEPQQNVETPVARNIVSTYNRKLTYNPSFQRSFVKSQKRFHDTQSSADIKDLNQTFSVDGQQNVNYHGLYPQSSARQKRIQEKLIKKSNNNDKQNQQLENSNELKGRQYSTQPNDKLDYSIQQNLKNNFTSLGERNIDDLYQGAQSERNNVSFKKKRSLKKQNSYRNDDNKSEYDIQALDENSDMGHGQLPKKQNSIHHTKLSNRSLQKTLKSIQSCFSISLPQQYTTFLQQKISSNKFFLDKQFYIRLKQSLLILLFINGFNNQNLSEEKNVFSEELKFLKEIYEKLLKIDQLNNRFTQAVELDEEEQVAELVYHTKQLCYEVNSDGEVARDIVRIILKQNQNNKNHINGNKTSQPQLCEQNQGKYKGIYYLLMKFFINSSFQAHQQFIPQYSLQKIILFYKNPQQPVQKFQFFQNFILFYFMHVQFNQLVSFKQNTLLIIKYLLKQHGILVKNIQQIKQMSQRHNQKPQVLFGKLMESQKMRGYLKSLAEMTFVVEKLFGLMRKVGVTLNQLNQMNNENGVNQIQQTTLMKSITDCRQLATKYNLLNSPQQPIVNTQFKQSLDAIIFGVKNVESASQIRQKISSILLSKPLCLICLGCSVQNQNKQKLGDYLSNHANFSSEQQQQSQYSQKMFKNISKGAWAHYGCYNLMKLALRQSYQN